MPKTRARVIWTLVALVIAVSATGCSGDQDSLTESVAKNLPVAEEPQFPEDWEVSSSSVTFAFAGNSDGVTATVTAKNASLEAVINSFRDKLDRPVTLGEGVDDTKTIKEAEIKMEAGSWEKLLELAAAKYGYSVEESANTFRVVDSGDPSDAAED